MKYAIMILVAGLLTSCYQGKTVEPAPPGPCDTDTVSFINTVYTEIINPNCNTSGCHDAASNSAGYTFESHAQISSNATTINDVINHNSGVTPMPLGQPKMADSLLQAFNCWIEQGLQDN